MSEKQQNILITPYDFQFKQMLSVNSTQKRAVALGKISGQEGQAIMIINAKIPDQQTYKFVDILKIFQNDIYSRFDATMEGKYQIQAIFPITQKHKNKYREKKTILVKQTAKSYQDQKQELLKKQLAHVGWVNNIIDGKAEVERVLYKIQDFIILPDFKFANMEEVQTLHLLVLFTDKHLHSIRDLRGKHIKLLQNIEVNANKVLLQNFKLEQGTCRMFFHYPPTFYQLHLHITNLRSQAANALVQRGHLLQNVISNLQLDRNYYQKATLMKSIQQ